MKKLIITVFCLILFISVKSYSQSISENQLAKKLFSFEDKEYFEIDDEVLEKLESDLLDISFNGIIISAPKIISVEEIESLPVLVGFGYSGDRDWDYPLKENCFIIATNLLDGSIYVEKLFQDKKRIVDEGEKVDKPISGLALISAAVFSVDVSTLFTLSWTKGEWSFSILYNDWISNNVNVIFDGEELGKIFPPDYVYPVVMDDHTLPNYSQTQFSPQIPEKGLQFNLSYVGSDSIHALICAGSFTINTKNHHLFNSKQGFDSNINEIIGIVPVTLLMLSSSNGNIIEWNWNIPIYEISDDSFIYGYFTIDILDSLQNISVTNNDNLIFMCINGIVYGPQKILFR